MKAVEANFLDFLKRSPQFVIPIYQRTYSWTTKECQQLWNDIIKAGKQKEIPAHFVGSIVYIEKGLYQVTSQSSLLVIDGQQRLATVMLLIEALARRLKDNEPVEGFSAIKLRHYYLINPLEEGEKKFKLILSQTDKESLLSIINKGSLPSQASIRIEENFSFFREELKKVNKIENVCNGLAKLLIVDISLNRDHDNPQLIFESLNSTGRELSQADLIRNYVLMGLIPETQNKLYNQYWRPMELEFGQKEYDTDFDRFMRHYLTVKTGNIPKIREIYEEFKTYEQKPKIDIEKIVSDLRTYAAYYCAMAFQKEEDPKLNALFKDIKDLRVDTAFPLLLELYNDYQNGVLSKDELLEAGRLIESYVFRRSACDIPTNSLNKTFATFSRDLKKDRYLESIKAIFLNLPSYRRFPRDEEFKQKFQLKDLYNFRNRSYWLRKFENHDRKEPVPLHEYTIEHVMPQNEDLSDEWKTDLGSNWKEIHDKYLHTLGNLTLTGYNAEYSDKPFKEKRDIDGGFKESPIRLNSELAILNHWNEQTILERATKLAAKAVEVWKLPDLEPEILEAYQEKKTKTQYGIKDYKQLLKEPMKSVFQELRKQILVIDPVVTEEYLKLYVAYKAETNFVDIVPQAKRLRLSLNMAFHEINDPGGICKDVSNVGRWGNGDVEVGLQSVEEIPYVLSLIRQSFEKQIGNNEIVE